ncbi:WD-40 repeat-containing protein [Nostoc sp. NIES-2111]|nr:WD-40 repeat-containing protein [Nostoc sp. NIES-2111]
MQWEENRTNFDRNLAVVIGINHYNSNGIHDLKTAVGDATTIADLLEKEYAYKKTDIIRLLDGEATLTGLKDLLSKTIPNQLKPTSGDRLIFYYAGHGIPRNSKDGPAGYLVPQDADLNKADSFLSMQYVYKQLSQLTCHHLLVILDCCFAGTFQWAGSRKLIPILETVRREHYDRFIRFPAWQVITSSAHDQEAMDVALDNVVLAEDNRGTVTNSSHSPFALALIEGLQDNRADLIPDGVVTAHELYLYLEQRVSELSKERQNPGLYPLRREYDRGEFIFTKPGFTRDQLQPAPPLDENNNPYRGLKSFDEKHAQFFFGRQALIEELAKRLLLPNQPLAVVLGVSGSGKSSLVKAGLIPYLRDKQAKQWYILEPMRPGELPFTSLARVLLPVVNANLLEQLSQVSFLDEALKRVLESKTQADRDLDRADRAKPESDRPFQINETLIKVVELWSSATPEAKLLLIEDYLAQLETLCLPEERQLLVSLYDEILARLNSLLGHLQQYPQYLISAIKTWSQNHPNIKLLLVIDQFEELITASHETQADRRESNETGGSSTTEPKQWQPFLEMLRGAIAACPEELRVVLTLRSDFEPRFLDSPLKSYWKDARFPVRAMNSDELRQAIEGPALKQALYFEPPELVGKLIDEVGQMPGALPLLSFTLSELYAKLYERWKPGSSDRALRINDYEELGGVAGALTRRATQEYDNLIREFGKESGKAYQATMRRVMLRMVTIEGGGVARRRVPESELVYPDSQENKRVGLVSDYLVKARLLVKGQETGEPYVEPAHDFLVRGWDKLQKWIKEEQEDLTLQQRLTPAALDWKHGRGMLWIEEVARLAKLEKVLESQTDNWLNKLEKEFVTRSIQEKQDRIEKLEEDLRISEERRIAAELELGSVIASRHFEIEKSLDSLLLVMRTARELQNWKTNNNPPLQSYPTVSPLFTLQTILDNINEQNRLNVSDDDAIWQFLGYDVGEEVDLTLSRTEPEKIHRFDNPNQQHFITLDTNGKFKIWELPNQLIEEPHQVENNSISNILFSPNGEFFITISSNSVVFWDLTGYILGKFTSRLAYVVSKLIFSPNSQQIALLESIDGGADTQFLHFFQVLKDTGKVIQIGEGGYRGYFGRMRFTEDSNYLITGAHNRIRYWNLKPRLQLRLSPIGWFSGEMLLMKEELEKDIYSSVRQNLYIEKLNDGKVRFHKGYKEILEVENNPDWFEQAFITSDEKKIATLGNDGKVRFWNLDGKQINSLKEIQLEHYQSGNQVIFSRDGQYVAVIKNNGIYILNVLNQKTIGNIDGDSFRFSISFSFSPNGQRIATVGSDRIVRLWDLRGRQLAELNLTNPQVASILGTYFDTGDGTDPVIGFSHDGKNLIIAVGEGQNIPLFWKIEELEDLLKRGCQWMDEYLRNPTANISEEERRLCKYIKASQT